MRAIYIIIVISVVSIYGCDTRRDILDHETVWVKVNIDWSKLGATPNGASVYFFPKDGSSRKAVCLLTNYTQDSIRLWQGNYSVLIFNETVDDHDYVRFRETDSYERFEAYSKSFNTDNKNLFPPSENVVSSPNLLAVTSLDDFVVTREMIEKQKVAIIECSPSIIVYTVEVKVHIRNIDNLGINGSYAVLGGLAEGKILSSGETNSKSVQNLFVLKNRKLNSGSVIDGYISSSFYSFGMVSDSSNKTKSIDGRHLISLYLKLRDGSMYEMIDKDITYELKEDKNGGVKLIIEVGLDGEIVLPDVKDISDPDSGFDVDVKDWGEEVITDITI